MARKGANAAKRAFLVPLTAAVAAAISACGGQTTTETRTITTQHDVTRTVTQPPIEKTVTETETVPAPEEESEEAEGALEAAPGESEYEPESSHYSHNSHSSHSSHVSSYGGGGGGHYSHSSHASHSSHFSSG